jgi:Protein of unknown function (DUF3631)
MVKFQPSKLAMRVRFPLPARSLFICEPLIAVADLADGNWPNDARAALVKLCAQEEDASTGIKLLAAIRSIFEETDEDRITTPRLLEMLTAIEDGPWPLMQASAADSLERDTA